jgi:SAM-dependent methyltransferase
MNTPLKLNLGCGPSGIDGWLNYDWGALPLLSKMPWLRRSLIRLGLLPASYDAPWPPLQLVDIRKPFPLGDNAAQFVYCSHVLEHLERWQALHVAREVRRVLAPGGCFRVVVPDLALICRAYLAGNGDRPAQEACRLLWGHPKDIPPAGALGHLSRRFIRPHEWAYDHAEMETLLREAGFGEVRRCKFREGQTPDLDKVELESHAPHSLYVEAVKRLDNAAASC